VSEPAERRPAPGRAGDAARGVGVVVFLQVVFALLYVWRTSFVLDGQRVFCLWDDGMISMRYARHLAEGHGLVWNVAGERVQGYSNLGVTLLMAAIHRLPLSPFHTSLPFQLVNVALLAVTTATGAACARLLHPRVRFAPLATAIALALYGPYAIWTLQGSDVGFVGASLVVAFWLLLRGRAEGRWPWALFPLLALGIAVRPDGTLFYGAFGLGAVLLAPRPVRTVAFGLALFALTWGALVATSWLYYGDPLPNTYYLKSTGMPRDLMLRSGVSQLLAFVPTPSAVLLPLGVAAAAIALRRDRAAWVAALCIALAFAYHVSVGGDWLAQYVSRFLVGVMPLYLVLVTGSLLALALRWRRMPAWAAACLAALLATGALHPGLVAREWLDPSAPTMLREYNEQNTGFGLYFRAHTDPDTSIALHWAGAPAYFSERPAIDVLGKSERHIAKQRTAVFEPAHSKWDWDYVLGTLQPDLILGTSRNLSAHPAFARDYYGVLKDRTMGVFLRRSARAKLHDPAATLVDLQTQRHVGPAVAEN